MRSCPRIVAGLESVGLIVWRLRSTRYGLRADPHELVRFTSVLSIAVQGACVIACALAARACGHRSALWLPIPSVAVAIVLATAMPWSIFWMMLQPVDAGTLCRIVPSTQLRPDRVHQSD